MNRPLTHQELKDWANKTWSEIMNREDIIRMAREAGAMPYTNRHYPDRPAHAFGIEQLERFAALVAQRVLAGSYPEMIALVAAAERDKCGRVRAAKPRELKPVGRGTLLDEQQFCFDKGWREGAASVRAAIRARGETK